MNVLSTPPTSPLPRLLGYLLGHLLPVWLAPLLLRLALAVPFMTSGLLKWDGFLHLNDVALSLFTDEFQLHLPGGPYPYPAPALMAFLSGCAEVGLPVLLVAGLGTRLAALGLMGMTLVIQLTVPTGWPIHLTWSAMAAAIAAWGPGPLSLDALLVRRWPSRFEWAGGAAASPAKP